MLQDLTRQLRQRLALPLPGVEAQYKMAHPERRIISARMKVPRTARHGAVLFLLFEEDDRIFFPLIERPEYDGVHSGQIALPGGSFELSDVTYSNTALRETQEEIGVLKRDVEVIGELTELYIPPSNFLVHPFVAFIPYKPILLADPQEVKSIIEVDLEYIMDETRIMEKDIKLSSGLTIRSPYIDLEGHTVWGATAMMISELKSVLFELGF